MAVAFEAVPKPPEAQSFGEYRAQTAVGRQLGWTVPGMFLAVFLAGWLNSSRTLGNAGIIAVLAVAAAGGYALLLVYWPKAMAICFAICLVVGLGMTVFTTGGKWSVRSQEPGDRDEMDTDEMD